MDFTNVLVSGPKKDAVDEFELPTHILVPASWETRGWKLLKACIGSPDFGPLCLGTKDFGGREASV